MKTLFFLWSAALIFTVAETFAQTAAKPTSADFGKLNWLEGTWTRTSSKPGRSGLEQWTRRSPAEWQGRGVTMHGKDTAFIEKLKLITKEGDIYYVADVPENKGLVYFKFTEISDTHFVCVNLQHDFPKQIAYRREGTTLKATISGDGKSVEYLFEKR